MERFYYTFLNWIPLQKHSFSVKLIMGVSGGVCVCVQMEASCSLFDLMNNILIFHFHQWKESKPDDLMDSKLRCVFELPSENDKLVVRSSVAHYISIFISRSFSLWF